MRLESGYEFLTSSAAPAHPVPAALPASLQVAEDTKNKGKVDFVFRKILNSVFFVGFVRKSFIRHIPAYIIGLLPDRKQVSYPESRLLLWFRLL